MQLYLHARFYITFKFQFFFGRTNYVAAKATNIRLLHGKIGFWVFFGPSSIKRGWTHIVLG